MDFTFSSVTSEGTKPAQALVLRVPVDGGTPEI